MSSWRNLNLYSKVGLDSLSLPAMAVAPWFFQIFIPKVWVVMGPVSIVLVICHFKKIRIRRLPALLRSRLFVGKIRVSSTMRNKGILAIAPLVIIGLFTSSDSRADFELIGASESTYALPAAKPLTTYANGLPKIQGNRLSGFGHETPLKDVMSLSIPATWDVRFKKPELRDMKIDFRADNVTSDVLLQDVASRYGVTIKIGDTSGVVTVDWTEGACTSGYDSKMKSKVIC